MGFFKDLLKSKPVDEYKKIVFRVAGCHYRQKTLKEVYKFYIEEYDAYNNFTDSDILEFGEAEWKIPNCTSFYCDCFLIPEPENEFDPKAIKVMMNDAHIGYVPADTTGKIHAILDRIKSITPFVCGGEYKEVVYDEETGEDVIKKGKSDLGVMLNIYYE